MSLANFRAQNHPQQTGRRGVVDEVDDRGTDKEFFASLDKRFGGFSLDVAAAKHNRKCRRYFTREQDGLSQEWHGNVWCNPPYSDIRSWVQKAWDEWNRGHGGLSAGLTLAMGDAPSLIVMLLPANHVEQAWWQDLVEPHRDKPNSPLRVEFLRGRLRFDRPDWTPGPKGDRPPFGCCLLIWGAA